MTLPFRNLITAFILLEIKYQYYKGEIHRDFGISNNYTVSCTISAVEILSR